MIIFILLNSPSYVSGNELYSINKISLQKDKFGYLHLFGEIRNISEKSLTNITLSFDFLDNNNNTLGSYFRDPEIDTLNPHQFSPFEIIYLDLNSVDNVKNYSYEVEYNISKEKPTLLKIDHVNNRLDFTGFYYINGKITNLGPKIANNVTVIATVFDHNDNILGITKAISEPFTIGIKENAAFGLAVNDKTISIKIKNYTLQAYSDKYLSNIFTIKR
ncbi:MAG: FxLYD domain-containing protein [Nitrososphaeraceae archaeon]